MYSELLGITSKRFIEIPILNSRKDRKLSIYQLNKLPIFHKELTFLFNRSIHQNIFFSPHFLESITSPVAGYKSYFAILHDKDNHQYNHLRFMMPFLLGYPNTSSCLPIIKALSNSFSHLGTPIIDSEEPISIVRDFLNGLMNQDIIDLPSVLVIPNVRLNSYSTQLIKAVSIRYGFPIEVTSNYSRPILQNQKKSHNYFTQSVSSKILEEIDYQWQILLEEKDKVSYTIARKPQDISYFLEEFLKLEDLNNQNENKNLLINHDNPNIIRKIVKNLSHIDSVRIHSLNINNKSIASIIVFVIGNEASIWKSTYDKSYAQYSPTRILLGQLTCWNLVDPNITFSDSCSIASDPTLQQLWTEKEPLGSIVIGLRQKNNQQVRQVAAQMHLYNNTKTTSQLIREKILKDFAKKPQKINEQNLKNPSDYL
ncbi:hypothetical protein B488_03280 [Liberibacter crescens BT-1]|uniref:BioF2-like acetyltransferase domain-containing protein n=1 Tax=Liberibacter crescens (strain BT-1) TaxID=1215343 RepID=L0EV98_LIBCB|nr:GNAT family N-acetyltransferase [Liberibacter crescens]AGA64321.1 hypothetical protein B488_03280 [Liberibacter crescens BT-1]